MIERVLGYLRALLCFWLTASRRDVLTPARPVATVQYQSSVNTSSRIISCPTRPYKYRQSSKQGKQAEEDAFMYNTVLAAVVLVTALYPKDQ